MESFRPVRDGERLRPPEYALVHHPHDLPIGQSKHQTTAGGSRSRCGVECCAVRAVIGDGGGGLLEGEAFLNNFNPKPELPSENRCFVILLKYAGRLPGQELFNIRTFSPQRCFSEAVVEVRL